MTVFITIIPFCYSIAPFPKKIFGFFSPCFEKENDQMMISLQLSSYLSCCSTLVSFRQAPISKSQPPQLLR